MSLIGRVYKLSATNCDKIYIGSSHCKYLSVRLAHHRQNHKNGWKDYQGLFDEGDPNVEVLEEISLNDRSEAWKLRELEEKHMNQYDNCINQRRCYLTPDERIQIRDASVKKYHASPLGKLALRKANLNQKLKKAKDNSQLKTIHPSMVKQIEDEIKFITGQQKLIKENHINQ
tara:strand:+ start:66 stop:584 length:519 start_codon:yes stop_codon:yes gene_type:complete